MKYLVPVLWLFASVSLPAQISDPTLKAILARMDEDAPNFRTMSAGIEMITLTAIINDKTVEYGMLRMQRFPTGEVRAVIDFSNEKSGSRQIGFFGNNIRIYYPKLKTYQDYDVGKNTDVLNQFLLLGFGTSGQDLARSYDLSVDGRENLAGVATTKILLVPKNEEVKKRLSKIEMWIPDNAAYPKQQQFYEPSGNYRIVTYSNVKMSSSIKGKLELKLPSDAKKQGS